MSNFVRLIFLLTIVHYSNSIKLLNDTYDINNIQWMLNEPNANTLRIMTFNTYRCGSYMTDGLNKVVKHIRAVNADIVALQVCTFG
jgi:hypothetical protein